MRWPWPPSNPLPNHQSDQRTYKRRKQEQFRTPEADVKATVTYDTYGHLFPERDTEITERLGEFFQRGVDFLWTLPDSSAGGAVRNSL